VAYKLPRKKWQQRWTSISEELSVGDGSGRFNIEMTEHAALYSLRWSSTQVQ
jgi:hypothetical protein